MIGKLAKFAALIFFAAHIANAETNGAGAVSCSGVGADAPADYAPPFISNGSIATTIDNLGGQGAGKFCGIISDVAWAARRYSLPERDLFSFGHYGCEISVGGESLGEPLKWTQTLDTSRGFVRTRVEYKNANVITTAFILQGSDILAVEKLVELKGASPAEKVDIKFSYSLAEKNSNDTRPRMLANASAENGSAKISYTAYGYAVYTGEISVVSGVPAKASAKKNSVELSASLPAKNGAARAAFFVCYSDDFGGRKISETSEKLKKTASRGFAALFEENSRAWLSKRTKSFVDIPDAKITEVFETSLYFLRALRTNWSY
ncbi:MAG: hypothetical protein IJI37_02230, partial [Opitutales bacterium]|nr:hypothetical protein [Opitutales bacterium]